MAENTITLEQAQKWARNWRNNPNTKVIAFLIPEVDLTQVMAEKNTVNIRTYLGIDDQNNSKLMIVGVDSNGKDLIDDKNGQYIYDMTSACQPDCDVNSPLFNI
ncbi:hypothetical protein [Flavobacterium sp.]|jgi:hypothetical protein|uniref:hypothetical protein n=1 Tax=Flavobacterium sp. TaxID=239 RepID=UPI0037BE9110